MAIRLAKVDRDLVWETEQIVKEERRVQERKQKAKELAREKHTLQKGIEEINKRNAATEDADKSQGSQQESNSDWSKVDPADLEAMGPEAKSMYEEMQKQQEETAKLREAFQQKAQKFKNMHGAFQAKKRKGPAGEPTPAAPEEAKDDDKEETEEKAESGQEDPEQLRKKLEEQAAKEAAKEEEIKSRPKAAACHRGSASASG
eukprot:2991925-Karenia_brevis.AAC.1